MPAWAEAAGWRRALTKARGDPIAMEFTALFLAVTVTMLAAWLGLRAAAVALFALTLAGCVLTYLHHATDPLTLSF